ncbi:MAG: HamA C-terminal domain-containing protein [Sphingobium sp.]
MSVLAPAIPIDEFVAALSKDHDDLGSRIRMVSHSVKCADARVNLHAHYLAFGQGKPTVSEFVDILHDKIVGFSLHRTAIERVQKSWEGMPPNKIVESVAKLQRTAVDLFKKAQKKTNRNGEFGELIAYLLIESVLNAPQFLAKMSLKANTQMPVHGSDGIHIGWDNLKKQLILYWGESKCHASVGGAITDAAKSISESLEHSKIKQELFLIEEYFDLSGFPKEYREAILSFLDPMNENYNIRIDTSVMLIAFDFAGFASLNDIDASEVEKVFSAKLNEALPGFAKKVDAALKKSRIDKHSIEIFFLPVPSISEMRKSFQNRIGWNDD